MNYDDMMGLEGNLITPELIKEHLMAMGSGAGAIMLASYALPMIPMPTTWKPEDQARLRSGIAIATGVVAGRALYDYNQNAAMAVVGAISGLGLAQLLGSMFTTNPVKGFGLLPEEMELSGSDEALLAQYGDYGAMNALASFEATSIQESRGAFAGPTVTNEQLYGFQAPVVQAETLGAYNPYLA
jgi:hypothetical protein